MVKRIALVGQMVATSRAFERLAPKLQEEGCDVSFFLAHGGNLLRERWEEMQKAVESAEALVVGVGDKEENAREEVAACDIAVAQNIPFGFFADTYDVIARPWLRKFVKEECFIFVINSSEKEKAQKLFPNAKVVVSGNPTWEDFFFPKLTREEVRNKLGVKPEEKMLLIPMGKDAVINSIHINAVIEAVYPLKFFRIFAALHLGHRKYDGGVNASEVYGTFAKLRNVEFVTKDIMSTSDMLPGCDLVVEFASTVGIEAACQRIPVIDYFPSIILDWLESVIGKRTWEPCELGIAKAVYVPDDLYIAIHELVFLPGSKAAVALKQRQEEVYPKPQERGSSVRIMTSIILSL